jgi:hypothetical protein
MAPSALGRDMVGEWRTSAVGPWTIVTLHSAFRPTSTPYGLILIGFGDHSKMLFLTQLFVGQDRSDQNAQECLAFPRPAHSVFANMIGSRTPTLIAGLTRTSRATPSAV